MLQPLMSKLAGKRIVLASGSPRRKEILDRVGLHFEVIPSTFKEDLDKSTFTPEDYVKETARHKTLEVAERLTGQNEPDLIIGADTVVALGDRILEKPVNEKAAFEMLSALSGNTHKVHTGVVLICPKLQGGGNQPFNIIQFHETTEVIFGDLSPEVINAYISSEEPMDKAGGYGIQALGGTLVKGIVGDYFNVVGFPLHHFCCKLVDIFR
ncbi:probable bifunctional dTTP/UTP pyrophosphatase/methyltransferase protein [Diadema setosum]|uniref:probable bifunctional dTTP/UTP pyrophosphatase/methyltransferase protein n=1 Tax=Diadema setosum TaxID=31175 RepID=UPI003B3B9109